MADKRFLSADRNMRMRPRDERNSNQSIMCAYVVAVDNAN